MAGVKKTSVKAEEVMEETAKAPEAAEEKKEPAKKPGKKTAVKKETTKEPAAKKEEIKTLDVYVKPQEHAAYYAVNGEGSEEFRIEY